MAEPIEIPQVGQRRGRPRKEKDTIKSWQFGRVAMILCRFDEVRRRGDKHSVAIEDVVDSIRQHSPELSISESEVKRTLATWRPREGRTVLFFDRTVRTPEEVEKHCRLREQLEGKRGLKLEVPPSNNSAGSTEVFRIRFGERPNYPRHNRKDLTHDSDR